MASSKIPTRLIYCVDGTYCTPDGTDRQGHGNTSNVYRIYASIKRGRCFDKHTNTEFNQEKFYEPGVGSADDLNFFDKVKAGATGKGYKPMIRAIYKKCCTLEESDEVWFFGFSRGAYIVRAVAGLLHHIGALQTVEQDFDHVYAKAVKEYVSTGNRRDLGLGQLHYFGSAQTKPPPQIQFVGVFDTVKALDDAHTHDISFNRSTQNFRHALALNEDRKHMRPKYEFPKFGETKVGLSRRSFIQAWFVGAHMDMGGSSEKDGLALYPLQWILGESQSKGLVLEFEQLKAPWSGIDDPLRVVFPESEYDGKGQDMWTCTTKNGVCVRMQDLRKVHQLQRYQGRYSIKINSREQSYWPRKARDIFNANEELRGYCGWAPQGTIIHPSVYCCLDEFIVQAPSLPKMPDRGRIENWRAKMLGTEHHVRNQGFWSDGDLLEDDGLKAIRILVCGNTGVGKSTLINQVFGVNVDHQVRLLIANAGSMTYRKGFVMKTVQISSYMIREGLKLVMNPRFCVEMNSARTQQTATEDLFKAVSEHTAEVPVIVVATKMDHFRAIMREEAREREEPTAYEASPEKRVELDKKYAEYASEKINERTDLIESEFRNLDVGHLDGCVAIARNDHKSIERLNQITLENVKDEKLQLLYIATQTASINLKISTAVGKVMQIYRRVLGTTATFSFVPTASTTNRAGAAMAICKAIVQCFGLPTVNYQTILEIVKNTVWDDAGHNALVVFSEAVAAAGVMGTILAGGLPVFLAAGAFNFPLVVPATTRLMLMLASDLILILVRAFRSTTTTCVGQPEERHVARAARDYRYFSGDVHREIFALVPKTNVVKSFRYGKVRLGLEDVIRRYQEEVTRDSIEDRFNRASMKSFVSDRSLMNEIEALKELVPKSMSELHEKEAEIRAITARPTLESPESTDESNDESIR
ncbi:MAG: hypothetical protein Q9202_003020 [Teloschistes flavicans]